MDYLIYGQSFMVIAIQYGQSYMTRLGKHQRL